MKEAALRYNIHFTAAENLIKQAMLAEGHGVQAYVLTDAMNEKIAHDRATGKDLSLRELNALAKKWGAKAVFKWRSGSTPSLEARNRGLLSYTEVGDRLTIRVRRNLLTEPEGKP